MPITINIGQEAVEEAAADEPKPVQAKIALNARRSLDGNYMILNHPEIDIIVMPEKNKVVSFSKNEASKNVYHAQDRLFSYLVNKGTVEFDSIEGGNIYNSLEAKIMESKIDGVNAVQSVLYNIGKFLVEEKPYYAYINSFFQEEEDWLLDPDAKHSTELGEVPQEERKGTTGTGMLPYSMYYEYY
jgi:hypothetical protein